jgi:predicted dehydrogenase
MPSTPPPPAPLVVERTGPLPDHPAPLLVTDARGWTADRVEALRRHAELGGVVVVLQPPAEAAWTDLLGVDRGPALPAAEVVVEATADPAARNLPARTVMRDEVTPLLPREGTRTVLRTRLHLRDQAAVTARALGDGLLVGTALRPGDDEDDPVGRVLARLWRRAEAPPRPVGIGVVGYGQHGGMGWLHGTAATAVDGLRLAAVAELHPGRLADAARRFPDAAAHATVEALLADPGVDVVLVATPPATHHEIARRALQGGRDVVVEKPLCFTAAQADDLLAVAAEAGRVLTVHQNRRWDPDHRAIRRLVADGRIGEVFNVETFVGGFEHPCTLWHSDREVSGGRLYDWGAHLIDQTLQLLGGAVPVEVTATGHKRVWHDVTNLDQIRVRLRFDDGREAEFLDTDVLALRRPKYVVQGTRGTIVGRYEPVVEERVTADAGYQRTEHHHAEGPARLTVAEHLPGWGLQVTDVPGLPAPPHAFHRALADHLQLGDPVPVDPVEVRAVTAVLEAADSSARSGGRPVAPA